MEKAQLFKQITDITIKSRDLNLEHWIRFELFSWQWWLAFVISILSPIIAWKYVNRKRILEIVVFGFFMNVLSTTLDVTGSDLVLWRYPIRLLPQTPLLYPVDCFVLPVLYMFIYQRYRNWKVFLAASALMAAALSFIVEPLGTWIGVYRLVAWRYEYSFFIYLLLAAFSKFITGVILKRQASD